MEREPRLTPIQQFMAQAGLGPEVLQGAKALHATRRWRDIVGEVFAQHSQPDRFEKGTLWVVVDEAAWAQEIRLMQEEILRRLNEAAGEANLFQRIRVSRQAKREHPGPPVSDD
jgi:predicted nucleic acid-binding Zn ribbon protein